MNRNATMIQRIVLTMLVALAAFWPKPAGARVVINEILYHAPGDLDDLEYIELHNTGDDPVDLAGWKFTKGLKAEFASGTRIAAGGFLVLCRNEKRFREYYPQAPVTGTFDSKLSNNGERLELSDARGRVVDTVKYQDLPPWPQGADGLSGSLERICPDSGGDFFVNWMSSPLSADRKRPAGTPGHTNACYSEALPPIVTKVVHTPEQPSPGQPLKIAATVRDAEGVAEVQLLYRIAGAGFEKSEMRVSLKPAEDGVYAAEIPAPSVGELVRYRLAATGMTGARRIVPAETEPCPVFTAYVPDPKNPTRIPEMWILAVSPGQYAVACRDAGTERLEVQDFVEVQIKKNSLEVRLAKGRALRQANDFQLAAPRPGRPILGEIVAAELFRRSGVVVPQREQVHLFQGGRSVGLHLRIEQFNRDFLRRVHIDDGGNLYRARNRRGDAKDRHENKSGGNSDDLVALFDSLAKAAADPAAQWAILRRQLHVEQAVSCLAANTLMGNQDGLFDDHYAYHDVEDTARWTLFPGDLDRAWGGRIGSPGDDDKANEPIPFRVPGPAPDGREGTFAKVLLSNPTFRKFYLARLRQLAEKVFTEGALSEILDPLARMLEPELRRHAVARKENSELAVHQLTRETAWIRSYLQNRRQFLLSQSEVHGAGPFTTDDLEKPTSLKAAKAEEKGTPPVAPVKP